ncbi:MAG: hypothetical protein ACREHD_04600, partial [Pirellulales bacterium]
VGAVPADEFGNAIAVIGDTIAVGAPNHAVLGAAGAGAVYLFKMDGTPLGAIDDPTPAGESAPESGDEFGSSLSTVGEKLLIGAPFTGKNVGAVYIASPVADTLLPTLNAPGLAYGYFGLSVLGIGENVLVGGPGFAWFYATSPASPISKAYPYELYQPGPGFSNETASAPLSYFDGALAAPGTFPAAGLAGYFSTSGTTYYPGEISVHEGSGIQDIADLGALTSLRALSLNNDDVSSLITGGFVVVSEAGSSPPAPPPPPTAPLATLPNLKVVQLNNDALQNLNLEEPGAKLDALDYANIQYLSLHANPFGNAAMDLDLPAIAPQGTGVSVGNGSVQGVEYDVNQGPAFPTAGIGPQVGTFSQGTILPPNTSPAGQTLVPPTATIAIGIAATDPDGDDVIYLANGTSATGSTSYFFSATYDSSGKLTLEYQAATTYDATTKAYVFTPYYDTGLPVLTEPIQVTIFAFDGPTGPGDWRGMNAIVTFDV